MDPDDCLLWLFGSGMNKESNCWILYVFEHKVQSVPGFLSMVPIHRNQIEAFKEVAEQGTLEEF